MKFSRIGRSGLQTSRLALGSWLTFGEAVDVAATAEMTRHAYDLGVNFFDTADVYANGDAELALGKALEGLPRHGLVIATKCFFPASDRPNDRGLSRKHVTESVHASLRRLRTDYLDLHQCHRFDPEVPLEETIGTYGDLIRQGKILYWGVSHWSATQIREACATADALGVPRPISNQPPYSILDRHIEAEIVPTSAEFGLGQVVFSPLAQGVLTGKYAGGARPDDSRAADARLGRWMGRYLDDATTERVERLRPLAADLGLSMAQLALAWCLRDARISAVIIGATRRSQLDENAKAVAAELPEDAVRAIDEWFPRPLPERARASADAAARRP